MKLPELTPTKWHCFWMITIAALVMLILGWKGGVIFPKPQWNNWNFDVYRPNDWEINKDLYACAMASAYPADLTKLPETFTIVCVKKDKP